MSEFFSPEATATQVKKLEQLPTEEVHVGVVAKPGDVGVEAEASKALGKGWSIAGTFDWMKNAGWSAVGGFNWKGKTKP